MVDFVALLKKSIDSQKNPTPQLRQKIYERARETMARKLSEKPLPEALVNAQMKMLEDAVIVIENEYNGSKAAVADENNIADKARESKTAKTTAVSETTPVSEVVSAAALETKDETKKTAAKSKAKITAPEKEKEKEKVQEKEKEKAAPEAKTEPEQKIEAKTEPEPEENKAESGAKNTAKAEQAAIAERKAANIEIKKPAPKEPEKTKPQPSKGASKLRDAIKQREQLRQKGEAVDSKTYLEKRKPLSFDFSLPQKKENTERKQVGSEQKTAISKPAPTVNNALHYDEELENTAKNTPSPEQVIEGGLLEEKNTKITTHNDKDLQKVIAQSTNISVAAIDSENLKQQPDVVKTEPNKYTDPHTVVDVETVLEEASSQGEEKSFQPPLNIDEAVSREKQYVPPEYTKDKNNEDLLEISPHTGDFDIVSDIFTQAARRSERQAAQKRFMIIIGSICAFVFIVAVGLFIASRFLTNKQNTITDTNPSSETTVVNNKIKLTQRLLSDGNEVDAGPASAPPVVGEGTTTAESSFIAPSQKAGEAIFYRARSETSVEKVETGSVYWSLVTPDGAGVDETAVRGDITIPNENFSLQMTLRRNNDESLPAAYLLELIFKVPAGFDGSGIDRVHELTFKPSEQSKGQELSGAVYAKFDDNYFLYALSATKPYPNTNLEIMRQLNWIRMVLSDKDGRFIELTFSKGQLGEQVFQEVLNKWLEQENAPTVYDENNSVYDENNG